MKDDIQGSTRSMKLMFVKLRTSYSAASRVSAVVGGYKVHSQDFVICFSLMKDQLHDVHPILKLSEKRPTKIHFQMSD